MKHVLLRVVLLKCGWVEGEVFMFCRTRSIGGLEGNWREF